MSFETLIRYASEIITVHCFRLGVMVELTRFALPGEAEHSTVVSVSEQEGQTELAPVLL